MKVGIIVGRFQSHKLTDGHKDLIRQVTAKCDKLIIFVGVYPLKPNFKNALTFEMRRWMLYEYILSYIVSNRNVNILPIVDVFNISLWSNNLDNQIKELISENDEVILYGSRDSFIKNYIGKFPTEEIAAFGDSSATKLREEVKKMNVSDTNEEFRKGVIWSLRNEA